MSKRRYVYGALCEVEGCGRRHASLGFCSMHAHRFRRHGDPEAVSAPRGHDLVGNLAGRFSVDPDGCWRWQIRVDRLGYARVWSQAEGRSIYVHRAVWEAVVGPIPAGMELDHLCSTRCCVNPDHLEPVSHQENCSRAVERRRMAS